MEVKVPGAMATVVAPVTVQLNVLLDPELMLVGFAVKEVMAGAEPVPEDEFGIVTPQPARPTHASAIRTVVRKASLEERSLRGLRPFPKNEVAESMRPLFITTPSWQTLPALSLGRAYVKRPWCQRRNFVFAHDCSHVEMAPKTMGFGARRSGTGIRRGRQRSADSVQRMDEHGYSGHEWLAQYCFAAARNWV